MHIHKTCWNERIAHGVGLGLGTALVSGGGILNLGLVFPIMLLAILSPNQNPKYALILAGLIEAGKAMSPQLDQNVSPSQALLFGGMVGCIVALVGYGAWVGSKWLYDYLKNQEWVRPSYLLLVTPLYVAAYIGVTVVLAVIYSSH